MKMPDMDGIESKVGALLRTCYEQQERIERLESALESLRDSISTDWKTAVREAVQDLREPYSDDELSPDLARLAFAINPNPQR